jgi:hypothetical protein
MNRCHVAGATIVALSLVGCGGGTPDGAASKPKSFEAAIGLDQASIRAREAKVQEEVRTCMKNEGFDYVPLDPAQGNFKVSIGGLDQGLRDKQFRKTKGYGITTGGMEASGPANGGKDDPNKTIRDALSDADKEAYDRALFGAAAAERGQAGEVMGGGPVIHRSGPEGQDDGGQSGCFGKAQSKVPGGPAELGASLKDLGQRIESDPEVVAAGSKWASCMAVAGFQQFEKPREIPEHLMGKLEALTSGKDPSEVDPTLLSQLQQEELAIARADDRCATTSKLTTILTRVQKAEEQRYLDEHPDLTAGN